MHLLFWHRWIQKQHCGWDPLMCVQVYHNNCTCINYLFSDKNLISHSRDFSCREFFPVSVFSALLEPSGFPSAAQSACSRKKAHLSSDNKTGIYIWGNGAFDLFIYFCCCCCCISHASLCVGEVCVCASLIRRAVFRNTKQRQRGRLDLGCIRLGTAEAPSGSLEVEKERGCEKKRTYSC